MFMAGSNARCSLEKLLFRSFKFMNTRLQYEELLFVLIRWSFDNSQALGQLGYDLLLLTQLATQRAGLGV